MVELTHHEICMDPVVRRVQSKAAGAVVAFLGTTREFTSGRQTLRLTYEAYHEMAVQVLEDLETSARRRWPIIECQIVHRLGPVELGEASILVAVSTPHRRDAFEAAQWLMDTIKQDVPIWKQEHWADGSQEWVHPGTAVSASSPPSHPVEPPASTPRSDSPSHG